MHGTENLKKKLTSCYFRNKGIADERIRGFVRKYSNNSSRERYVVSNTEIEILSLSSLFLILQHALLVGLLWPYVQSSYTLLRCALFSMVIRSI
jgi:hypothetical protein